MQKLQPLPSRKVEKRIVRQLIEAILFEGLMDVEKTVPELDDTLVTFTIFGKGQTYFCEGKITAFDRVRVKEESIRTLHPDGSSAETRMKELTEDLISDPEKRSLLIRELEQTALLVEWNEANLMPAISRRGFSYEELESEIWEGHPYHPCFKARTGFTLEDHAAFGPEARQSFVLQWAAVKREHSRIALLEEDEQGFWEKELGPSVFEQMLDELQARGKDFHEYTLMPIHPWQVQYAKAEVDKGEIVLLKTTGDSYRATQSVRTLWNASDPEKAHVKLSMNMVNTSSLRTLNTHAICAAPPISQWIADTVESDRYLKEEASLIILKEYAGVAYQPTEQTETKFGAIWRESIRLYTEEEEEAVPFTALPLIERDGMPFLDDWLKRYGTEKWLTRLIEVSVVPVWHLLVSHGIAVEAHAQNMILLHENGLPTRVALRDFHDSTEYHHAFLKEPSKVPEFSRIHEQFNNGEADEYYWMSSVEALRELVMDTLFVFHLSELSFALQERYGFSEERFWEMVRDAIAGHMNRYPELLYRNSLLHHTAPTVFAESLLKRKTKNEEAGGLRHLVTNSLAESQKRVYQKEN